MKKRQTEITVLARKAVTDLWEAAWLRGRCWGRKLHGNNCFRGTNITMALNENELVSICQIKGELIIHCFVRNEKAVLGKKVKRLLLAAGLPVK